MKRYLLWDFDGTLAFRDGMWSPTLYELLQEYGIRDISVDDIRQYMKGIFPWDFYESSHEELFCGLSWWSFMLKGIKGIIKKFGVSEAQAAQIALQFPSRYLNLSRWHLFEDTVPYLEKAVALGYINIILSNHVPELDLLVKGLGIDAYFKEIHSSANIGYDKPNIGIFRHAVKSLEDNADITMIGDNYTADIQGALNAGLKAVLVRKENLFNYPEYCKDLQELFHILAGQKKL